MSKEVITLYRKIGGGSTPLHPPVDHYLQTMSETLKHRTCLCPNVI